MMSAFDALDRNHDGVITRQEFMAGMGAAPAPAPMQFGAPMQYAAPGAMTTYGAPATTYAPAPAPAAMPGPITYAAPNSYTPAPAPITYAAPAAPAQAMERDVEVMLDHILEECDSVMDADRFFRAWLHRMEQKANLQVRGRQLTKELVAATRTRCHMYWSKVTPGNVAPIVDNLARNCANWESAEKIFFIPFWKRYQWDDDNALVNHDGRNFSKEDLEIAERRCRRRFSLPATLSVRTPGGTKPSVGPAPKPPPAQAAAAAAPGLVAAAPKVLEVINVD